MRFIKEYILLILIIVFIISIEIITVKITQKCLDDMNYDISVLEENKKINEKMKILTEDWKTIENKMSFYMEHDELERISTEIINLKSNIETKNKENIKEGIDEIKFRLEHIKNKQRLILKNIF